MDWDLLEKTTFWVEGMDLDSADLDELAREAAAALNLEPGAVMVVDVRPGLVAFDILKRQVRAEDVAGQGAALLARLARLPGVAIQPEAAVHSEGVLGFLALSPQAAQHALAASAAMAQGIKERVARRALVFASGAEVAAGSIRDTNSPHIIAALQAAGFAAGFGGVLPDEAAAAANILAGAAGRGLGLIVTTGGVGAEDKDWSIEAILRLDPQAATPYILKFEVDHRRHHKAGVRIAVGQAGLTTLVALPGPHAEAALGCAEMIRGITAGLAKAELAEAVAAAIRERWRAKLHERGNGHGHPGHR